jgi:hypothetical protein
VNVGIQGQHHGRIIGGRVRMGERSPERAAIPDLLIANLRRRVGNDRTPSPKERGRGDVVMDGPRADFNPAVRLANAGQFGYARDVDQDLRFAQAQLHQRHQAVPTGNELALAARARHLREGIVERRGACVFERERDHDRAP